MRNSAVVWEGRSRLPGRAPIVAIVSGLTRASMNTKTGRMAQLWILRADQPPTDAQATGADAAVCGNCPLRPALGGGCYVVAAQAPQSVWRSWRRGRVPRWGAAAVAQYARQRQLPIRLGAYGDPAAVPIDVIRTLAQGAPRHTGYTHQWRTARGRRLQPYCMASVDNGPEASVAQAQGWRTFRTSWTGPAAGEITCPASEEAGKRTTCARCTLCDGAQILDGRKSIVIRPHGYAVGRMQGD